MTKLTKYAIYDKTSGELSIGSDTPGLVSWGSAIPVGTFASEQEAKQYALERGCVRFNGEALPKGTGEMNQTDGKRAEATLVDSDELRRLVGTTKGFPILDLRWNHTEGKIECFYGANQGRQHPSWGGLIAYPLDREAANAVTRILHANGFQGSQIEASLKRAHRFSSGKESAQIDWAFYDTLPKGTGD